jgi:hypothetical protein
MRPKYILRQSLSRPVSCGHYLPDNATDEQQKSARDADIRSAISEIENMDFSAEYAEPGYSNPLKGILFADWNYFPRGIDSILERYGYQIEWSDEWTTCEQCGRAVRTSPDSHGYQPSYVILNDCEIVCVDCLNGDAGDYLESLENHPNRALNVPAINPAKWGYVQLEDGFESGFHPGQNDNPKAIYARLHAQYPRLLFKIDGVGQFDFTFSVWHRPES